MTSSTEENNNSILPNEITTLFLSNKWEEKKEGFIKTQNFLLENNNVDLLEVYSYIKVQVKNFKETNINLIKESLKIFLFIIENISKTKGGNYDDIVRELANGLYEKISDNKISPQIEEIFWIFIKKFQNVFFPLIFTKLKKEKKNNVLKGYAIFLENIITKTNSIENIDRNELVPFCVGLCNNPNPQIRTEGINLLSVVYKYIGYELRKMINDGIKGSTFKLIEEAFGKIDSENINNYLVNTTNTENEDKSDTSDYNSNSKDVKCDVHELIKCVNQTKVNWNERKEAIEKLHNELINSKDGFPYDDVIALIKNKINDKQQKFLLMIISLLSDVILKLKKNFKGYLNIIIVPLINNLNDNNEQIRKDTISCLNLICEYCGFDNVIPQMGHALKTEKYDLRFEILTFFIEKKEKIVKFIENITESLLLSLQDKSNIIRSLGESLIKFSCENKININVFYDKLTIFKPVTATKIKEIVNSCYNIHNEDQDKMNLTWTGRVSNIEGTPKKKNQMERKKSYDNIKNLSQTSPCALSDISNITSSNSKKKTKSKLLPRSRSQSKDITTNSSKNKRARDYSSDQTPKGTSSSLNPSSSNKKTKNEPYNIFREGVDFISLKKSRNSKDIKLKTNYISIKDTNVENIASKYLSPFLTENFIKSTITASTSFSEAVKVLILLFTSKNTSELSSFQTFLYPNLDLIIKFIIKQMTSNLISKTSYTYIISLFSSILEILILNDLYLDIIETVLVLQTLVTIKANLSNEKNGKNYSSIHTLIKKYMDFLSLEKSFYILFDYCIENTNTLIKEIVFDLFKEQMDCGKISIENHIENFKLIVQLSFTKEKSIKEKIREIFKTIYTMLGEERFNNEIIFKMAPQQIETIKAILGIKQEKKSRAKEQNSIKKVEKEVIEEKDDLGEDQEHDVVINSKNDIIELLNEITEQEDPIEKEMYFSILNDIFTKKSNLQKNKKIILEAIELIIQTLLCEIEKYYNIFNSNEKDEQNYVLTTLTLLYQITKNETIVKHIAKEVLYKISVALFNYLQVDIEKEKMKKTISHKMNSIILNIIEKGNFTDIIINFLVIADEYKYDSDISILASNCLLNLSKEFSNNNQNINVPVILNKLNEIMSKIDEKKVKNDQKCSLFIKCIKKIIVELVKLKGEDIIVDYNNSIGNSHIHDKSIAPWIDKTLSYLESQKISISSNFSV